MSGLSDHLHSGRAGAPVGCGGAQAEGKAALGGLEELWSRELELQEGPQDPGSRDGLALVTPDFIAASSSSSSSPPSALSNGLHLQTRRPGHSSCRRRDSEGFPATLGNMQTPSPDPDVRAQAISRSQARARVDFDVHAGCVAPEGSRTPAVEAVQTTSSSRPPSLALGNHAGSAGQAAAAPAAITTTSAVDMSSTFSPVPGDPIPGSASPPAEAEKKYALRSSGRPRFPCHLRKSSRLRRGTDDGEKKAGQERVAEEEVKALEEKIWRIKEEEAAAAVAVKEEPPPVEAPPRTAPCPADVPQSHGPTPPKNPPKAVAKPGPRLGHRPGPKSRSRPALKPVHKAAPKSVLKRRQAAQAMTQLSLANTTSISAPAATVKQEPVADLGASSSHNRRRGRFVGVSFFFMYSFIYFFKTLQ